MGLYSRGDRYYFKKQFYGKVYYRALRLRKGQERLLSERLQQVEEEIIAKHFGLEYTKQTLISLDDYIKKYLKSKKHKKSLKLDHQRLAKSSKIWRDPLLSQISRRQIEKLDQELSSRGLKKSTVNRYFEVLRSLFNLALQDGYIKENPCRHYVPYVEDGELRTLSREEARKILAAAAEVQECPRSKLQSIFYDLVVLDLNTGMRLSELLKLKKEYIRDQVIFYPITETKHRRRASSQKKKVKVICLNSTAMAIIDKQKSRGRYVFSMEWRDPKAIRRTVARIRELSGVRGFTFHQLRHFVSTFLSNHVSLTTAKIMLGHSDIKTTLRYTHPEIKLQREGVAKIETFFKSELAN